MPDRTLCSAARFAPGTAKPSNYRAPNRTPSFPLKGPGEPVEPADDPSGQASYFRFLLLPPASGLRLLPEAYWPSIAQKAKPSQLIELTGFYLVAGRGFEPLTFRL